VVQYKLVHTGQHYDVAMSDVFFRDLGIPAPDFNLEVGSGSHAVQTARIMERFEPVLLQAFEASARGPQDNGTAGQAGRDPIFLSSCGPIVSLSLSPVVPAFYRPDWAVVVGDVNSTMACTLVAAKLEVKVAHIEAGLRSFDRTMPEEINRIVTDSLADLLLTPSQDASENLRREGISEHKIRLVGNIMIDSLVANLERARSSRVMSRLGLEPGRFAYVTLHRPSNVDQRESLLAIMGELERLAVRLPVVFPLHPRTRKMLSEYGIAWNGTPGFKAIDPIGYHDSLCLTENARLVLTDSGGLQEEATYFRTPCLTLRPNTERPITITVGSNRLTAIETLREDLQQVLAKERRLGAVPRFWDGKAAERILACLLVRMLNVANRPVVH
jgi:UDP-N-acetylglucosamine 2-epimerase (non-hydrolysing)